MLDRLNGRTARGGVVAVIALVGLLGAACSGEDASESAATAGGAGGGADMAQSEGQFDREFEEAPASAPKAMEFGGSAVPSVGASIIKTADIRLETPRGDFTQSVQEVESAAARYGGFVFSTSLDDTSTNSGTIVLRVPSEDFESALRDVKGAGELLGENIAGKDVSQEFIDLEARINNLQAQEGVFLGLMDRATTLSQTIRIQNQLSSLQLDIEQLQGRLNFLEDRTSLGTITVSLIEAGAPVPTEPNTFEVAWERAVDTLEGLGAVLIFLVVAILFPLSLIALIGLVIFRQVKPRLTS